VVTHQADIAHVHVGVAQLPQPCSRLADEPAQLRQGMRRRSGWWEGDEPRSARRGGQYHDEACAPAWRRRTLRSSRSSSSAE
jgi:hypothetical protein